MLKSHPLFVRGAALRVLRSKRLALLAVRSSDVGTGIELSTGLPADFGHLLG